MYLDVAQYQQLSDDEILNLARDQMNLTGDEAREALSVELSRRNISLSDIQTYAAETGALDTAENHQLRKLLAPKVYGNKKFLGRNNFVGDASSGSEEYDATLWFVVYWFPLIPLGTYRVRRNRSPKRWWNLHRDIAIMTKLPLNWKQILRTWLIAVSVVFAAILILPHIAPFLTGLVGRLNHRR